LTEENLFNNDTTPNAVDQLVGDGKKFKTTNDLAQGKIESDRFIEKLTKELDELRSDLNARERMEELLARLENQSSGVGANSAQANQASSERPTTPDITQLIEQTITKRDAAKTAQDNLAEAKRSLQNHFGADYEARLRQKATDLGIGLDAINDLAKQSPKALLELVGATGARPSIYNTPTSSMSTERMGINPNSGTRNYKYYQDLKAKDKSHYWTSEVQLQMHKDAIAAADRGEDFYK
jgi:hypothetical protein